MKGYFFLLLSLGVYWECSAQTILNNFFKIDTVIFLQNVHGYSDVESIPVAFYKDNCYFNQTPYSEPQKDTLEFISLNLSTYKLNEIILNLPYINIRTLEEPYLQDFFFNNDSVIIGYSNFIAIFVKEANGFRISSFIPLFLPYTKLNYYKNRLYLSNTYKSTHLEKNWMYVTNYDLSSHKFISAFYSKFRVPEFCHFLPNRWFDFYLGKSIYSSTIDYRVDLLDENLNSLLELKRDRIKNWVQYEPSFLLDSAIKKSKNRDGTVNSSSVISYLNQHIRKISRIEEIGFINDSIFFVKWIPIDSTNKVKNVSIMNFFDIWNFNTGKLEKSDLRLKIFSHGDVTSKLSFPILDDSKMLFCPYNGKLICIRLGGKYSRYLNCSLSELNQMENQYLKYNDEVIQVFIFSTNF